MKEKKVFPIKSNFTDLSIIKEDNKVLLEIGSNHNPKALETKAVVCK